MKIFVIIEEYLEFEKVNFYTVRLINGDDEETESETDRFINKHDDDESEHFEELLMLLNSIESIGKRGAFKRYFRFENDAEALPSPAGTKLEIIIPSDTKLRLYCIRLNDEAVILLNGGIKTDDRAQNCPNVSNHFRFANALSKKITRMLVDKEIKIEGKNLEGDTSFYL